MFRNKLKPYTVATGLMVLIMILSTLFTGDSLKLQGDPPGHLDEGWIYESPEDGKTAITLPLDLNAPAHEVVRIHRILQEEFDVSQNLLIRSSQQDIRILLDGEAIYEQVFSGAGGPMASVWNLVSLPEGSAGKVLEIQVTSPFKAMSGVLNEIFYGDRGQLHLHIAREYGIRLVFAALIFFISIIVLGINVLVEKDHAKGNAYLGFFAQCISLWILGESRMLQFITGNQYIIGGISYIMLSVFPIPLLIYLKDVIILRFRRTYLIFIVLFSVNLFLILTLEMTGVSRFFQSLWMTHLLIFAGLIMVMTTLLLEIRRYGSGKALKFLRSFSVLMLFGLVEMIYFVLGQFEYTSIFTLLGLCIYMILLLVDYVTYIFDRLKSGYASAIYEKLAFQDRITGGKNRMAFEQDLELLFLSDSKKDTLRLIYFDLDDLKQINDTYGHNEGDAAIQKAYECIRNAFGDMGECYRIGGDEYACISTEPLHEVYSRRVRIFEEEIQRENGRIPYAFRISVGSATYDASQDLKPSDLMKRADEKMYENKRLKKRLGNDLQAEA